MAGRVRKEDNVDAKQFATKKLKQWPIGLVWWNGLSERGQLSLEASFAGFCGRTGEKFRALEPTNSRQQSCRRRRVICVRT